MKSLIYVLIILSVPSCFLGFFIFPCLISPSSSPNTNQLEMVLSKAINYPSPVVLKQNLLSLKMSPKCAILGNSSI